MAQLDELQRRAGLSVEERRELLRRDLALAEKRMRRLQTKLSPVDFKSKRVWIRREWHHFEDKIDLLIIDSLIKFAKKSPGEYISLKDMGRFFHKELMELKRIDRDRVNHINTMIPARKKQSFLRSKSNVGYRIDKDDL